MNKNLLKLNNPDEWGNINYIRKFFGILNDISVLKDKEIKKLKEIKYNNVEIGISDEELISQIAEPADWEVASKTKNSEKIFTKVKSFQGFLQKF